MELNDAFIGRQPILDREQRIFGYELLFRNGRTGAANVVDNAQATASVMLNALNNIGVRNLIGETNGFVNVDEEILKSGIVELLPKEQTVLEILETVRLTEEVVDICRRLRHDGYRLALDDFVYDESFVPLFDMVDYVKIDVLASSRETIEDMSRLFRKYHLRLLAEKVEKREDFDYLRQLGFSLFQGYFFAKPSILAAKTISPTHMVLIDLLRLLSKEAEFHSIEQLFRKNPELQIKLLKFINSASFYSAHKITSIGQSISLLGYRKLQKWVTLLLFAGSDHDMKTNPLLERAAIRGRLAELLMKKMANSEAASDSAFITGVLSLIDALFKMPMDKAVKELNLSEEIQAALIRKEGLLGKIIAITEGLEGEAFIDTADLLGGFRLTLDDLFSMEKTAIIEYENYAERKDHEEEVIGPRKAVPQGSELRLQ
jgi:c-di-GMP-related signal transduction protein